MEILTCHKNFVAMDIWIFSSSANCDVMQKQKFVKH